MTVAHLWGRVGGTGSCRGMGWEVDIVTVSGCGGPLVMRTLDGSWVREGRVIS